MGTEPGFKDKLVWLQTVRGFILSPMFNHQTWQCFEISMDVSVSPRSSTGTPKRRLFSPPWKILFFFTSTGGIQKVREAVDNPSQERLGDPLTKTLAQCSSQYLNRAPPGIHPLAAFNSPCPHIQRPFPFDHSSVQALFSPQESMTNRACCFFSLWGRTRSGRSLNKPLLHLCGDRINTQGSHTEIPTERILI